MKYLLVLGVLLAPMFSHANSKFAIGLKTELDIIEIETDFPIPNSYIYLQNEIYVGLISTATLGFTQVSVTLLPGFRISQPVYEFLDRDYSYNFFFHEAYLRIDGLSLSFSVGKTLLGWGVGTLRQFTFIESDSFQSSKNRYYNTEFLFRKDATLLSVGVAMDTDSIDAFEKPEWYSPWLYVQYDNADYQILASLIAKVEDENVYEIRPAFEFQYFLPKNFEIYGSIAYTMLTNDKLGGVNQLSFLAGLSYEYRVDNNVFFIPQIEYVFENGNNMVSGGVTARIYQVELQLFGTYNYTEANDKETTVLTRLTWSVNQNFSAKLEYQAFFFPDQPVLLKHQAQFSLIYTH